MWPWLKSHLLFTWGGLHRYFGNANGVRREYERAIHYFDLAYRANPGFHQALIAGAVLRYRELGNADGAIASLSGLLEQSPEHGSARFNRALAYQEAGRYQEALEDLRAFLGQGRPGDENYGAAERLSLLLADLLEKA
jgi:tetratricopeptide (TPR) repeat protein